MVLRNQADLLYSQYVEEYHSFDLLHDSKGKLDVIGLGVYHYPEYLVHLRRSFENITICLFEDMKHKPDLFWGQISALLGKKVTPKHENQKRKSPEGYYTKQGVLVPYFPEAKKAEIMSWYNNERLVEWGISRERLVEYGYLPKV